MGRAYGSLFSFTISFQRVKTRCYNMGRAYGSFIRFGIRYMGLVKEPKNIDFTVINKKWTVSELNELSAFIKLRKEQKKKRLSKKKQRVKS